MRPSFLSSVVCATLALTATALAQLPKAATPTFTQPGGTYNTQLLVGLSDATPGAVMYYTINGTTPTSDSSRYTGPQTVRQSMTVTAIADAPGHAASDPVSESFSFTTLPPVFGPISGTYDGPLTVTLTSGTPTAKIFYTTRGNLPTTSSTPYTGPFQITEATTIIAMAAETGFASSGPVTASYLIGPVIAPQISPASGTYLTSPTVTISVTPSTAKIFYTTDGSTPSAASTLYTGPFTVNSSEIVKAIGVLPNLAPSPISTQAYLLPFLYPVVGYFRFYVKDPTGDTGDGGPASSALMYEADDVAFDSVGNLYVVDSVAQVVRKVSVETGIITTVAGTYVSDGEGGTEGYSGDGGPATSAMLARPTCVAFDSHDNMYITEVDSGTIRKVNAATGIITTVAGTPAPPPGVDNGGYSGDGGLATDALLLEPMFVALDSHDNLYIADTYNDAVRRVDASSGIITTVAGTGPTSDYKGAYTGDGGLATDAQILAPTSIAFDKSDNLYIAGGIAVRQVSAVTGKITTVAGGPNNTQGPYGTAAGDGGLATKAYLEDVTNVAFDPAGNFYVTGPTIDSIRRIDATSGVITRIAGALDYGNNGYYGAAIYADLEAPYAVTFDPLGNLYFGQFNTVAKISLSPNPGPAY